MLQDLTGVDPKTIPTNDTKVMSLFTTSEALGIDLSYINCKSGALGLSLIHICIMKERKPLEKLL